MVPSVFVTLALFSAAAALKLDDSKEAAAEIAKACMKGDYEPATAMLEARGKPIGWQHGKYLLMSCFTDETGQCLLDNTQCAWLQKCMSEEGPCGAPPISALLELPGGETALAELKANVNASVSIKNQTHYKMKNMVQVLKKMANKEITQNEDLSQEASSLIQQESKAKMSVLEGRRRKDRRLAKIKEEEDLISTTPDPIAEWVVDFKKPGAKLKKGIDNMRNNWLDTKQKRRMIFQMLTLPLYYLATCGMEDMGVMTITPEWAEHIGGTAGKPLYAKFAPNGAGKKPAYIDAVHNFTWHKEILDKGGEWLCFR